MTGVVTVGCEGWLEQAEVEMVSGLRRIELPAALAFGTAERLHRLGVIPAPASDLQYVVHPWVVPSTRLREAGLATGVRQPDRARPAARAGARPPRAGLAAGRPAGRDHRGGRGGRGGRRHRRAGAARPGGSGADGRPAGVHPAARRPRRTAVGRRGLRRGVRPGRRRDRAVRRDRARQDGGRGVAGLGYSAHPGVLDELRTVAEEVAAAHPVRALAAVHRVGDLAVGDLAVVVGVSCAHRGDAFAAARMLIDELKSRVPIWKHQVFDDGGDEWVGLP